MEAKSKVFFKLVGSDLFLPIISLFGPWSGDILKNGKPKRLGEPVLQLVEERFARIKVTSHRSKEHLIPDFMQVKNKGDKRMEDGDDQWYRQRDSELRSLRRSLDRAKKTLKSVQEGKFPN